jgi:hypothetical protein
MRVLGSSLNSSDSSPFLMVWFDHEWVSTPHMVEPESVTNDEVVRQLPPGLQELLQILGRKRLISSVEFKRPPNSQQSENLLQVNVSPVVRGASGITRLHECVTIAERLTGWLRPTDDVLLEASESEERNTLEPDTSPQLRLRWLLAMRRLLDRE